MSFDCTGLRVLVTGASHLLSRPSARIVNISSISATLSSPGEAAYDATKAGLTAFSEAMAVDLWETGVEVLVVYPGLIDTELFSIPDNDPVATDMEPLPVADLVTATFDALDRGLHQVYVPEWFQEIAAGKAANVEGYLSGTAQYLRER